VDQVRPIYRFLQLVGKLSPAMSISQQEEFDLPKDLDEAEERRVQLTLDVQGIQAQLGDKQRTDDSGRRLSSQEYWNWKKRAQHALNFKLNELRAIKKWIKDTKRSMAAPVVEVVGSATLEEAVGHLAQLYQIISDLREEEVEFNESELAKIFAAGNFLRRAARA